LGIGARNECLRFVFSIDRLPPSFWWHRGSGARELNERKKEEVKEKKQKERKK
jgi:hypothetical protein